MATQPKQTGQANGLSKLFIPQLSTVADPAAQNVFRKLITWANNLASTNPTPGQVLTAVTIPTTLSGPKAKWMTGAGGTPNTVLHVKNPTGFTSGHSIPLWAPTWHTPVTSGPTPPTLTTGSTTVTIHHQGVYAISVLISFFFNKNSSTGMFWLLIHPHSSATTFNFVSATRGTWTIHPPTGTATFGPTGPFYTFIQYFPAAHYTFNINVTGATFGSAPTALFKRHGGYMTVRRLS